MFQHTSALGTPRVLEAGNQVHVTEAPRRRGGQVGRGQVCVIHEALGEIQIPVEIEEARSGLPDISGHGGK